MKKRSYILAAAALAAAVMLAGCESKNQDKNQDNEQNAAADNAAGSSEEALNFKVTDYVKLGDYKGLEVTYPAVLEVADEDVQQYREIRNTKR